MMWKTHLAFGGLIGLLLIPILKPSQPIIFFAIVLFASLLPDIDHPDSKLGRKVKIISKLFKHRGFFHSIFGVALFTLPFLYFKLDLIAIPLLIGYCSHLLGDLITLEGIMPFYPLRISVKGFMRVNSWTETGIFVLLLIFIVFIVKSMWF